MKKRANLSPAEREDVKRLYKSGGHSLRKLANHFGCSKSTIDRIVKGGDSVSVQKKPTKKAPTPQPAPLPPRPPTTSDEIPTPLHFKTSKLEEVSIDLDACRMRGQYNVLPSLHRLHLSLYDECNQLKQEQKEIEASIKAEGAITNILTMINQMPPVIKQQIEKEILSKKTKVITFPTALKNES